MKIMDVQYQEQIDAINKTSNPLELLRIIAKLLVGLDIELIKLNHYLLKKGS